MAALANPRQLRGPLGLAALALLACLGPRAAGQGTEIHYLKDTTFRVPFVINASQQGQIQKVMLYVSEDFGKNYMNAGQALPSDTSFLFTAKRQGWYWFVVQAQYKDGHSVPSDPQLVQPGLKICVDTVPPVVTLRQVQPREGTVGIEWDIRDDNPDLLTLRVDYRPVNGSDWIPLLVPQMLTQQYGWTPAGTATAYDVRLTVSDRAKNTTERTIRVAANPLMRQPLATPEAPGVAPKATMVNSKHIRLNFDVTDIGKSNVAAIEVWMTQDTQTWKSMGKEAYRNPATIDVTVPSEGRFGFTLIAVSGAGKSERPPARGEQPDIWVQVDESKPVVRIVSTDVGGTPDNGQMTIKWSVQDPNLTERPIRILYAANPSDKWSELARELPPGQSSGSGAYQGSYVWAIPHDLPDHQYYIRVEAIDQANNVGMDQTPKPIPVDLATPKARIRAVEPAGPGGTSSLQTYPETPQNNFNSAPSSTIVPVSSVTAVSQPSYPAAQAPVAPTPAPTSPSQGLVAPQPPAGPAPLPPPK
jgi:hypothetical protein